MQVLTVHPEETRELAAGHAPPVIRYRYLFPSDLNDYDDLLIVLRTV